MTLWHANTELLTTAMVAAKVYYLAGQDMAQDMAQLESGRVLGAAQLSAELERELDTSG